MTEWKKSGLFTLAVATMALSISIGNTYLQFFRSTNDLKFVLPIFQVTETAIVYELVFINGGSTYQTVMSAKSLYWDLDDNEEILPLSISPIIVKPDEMIHIKIDQLVPARYLHNKGQMEASDSGLFMVETDRFFLGLEFDVVDSTGNIHRTSHLVADVVIRRPGNETSTSIAFRGGVYDLMGDKSTVHSNPVSVIQTVFGDNISGVEAEPSFRIPFKKNIPN